MNCPNCNAVFIEHRDTAYHCVHCGWFRNVDGKWVTCPEPVKVTDPPIKKEPLPAEPVRKEQPVDPALLPEPGKSGDNSVAEEVREYFGGRITVTVVDDEELENETDD